MRAGWLVASIVPVVLGLIGGCSSSTSNGGGSSLPWGKCARSYDHAYTCANLAVPLDPAQPAGATITIALIRTKATGSKIGSLLVNPGGPGQSALESWDYLSETVSPAVRKRFDLVGFDPRGVGDSTSVRCADPKGLDAYTALDFDPQTSAQRQALIDGAKALADGCVARSGSLLPYVGTAYAAADMDRIRAAVGDEKLTYLGFSYGTFLGAEYAHLFPDHVRAMVLDGALDPSEPPVQSTIEQSAAFQRQLDRFLADCASKKSCAWTFTGDAHAAFRALVAKVDQAPLPAGGGRVLAPGQLFVGVGVALYDQSSWPVLARALQAVSRGDGSAMLMLADQYNERNADGTYSNSIEANLAINCRDYAPPASVDAAFAAAAQAAQAAPDLGASNMNLGLACVFFPPADTGTTIGPLTAAGAPPIVVVATTGDPATPYDQGVALAKELTTGVLVTNVGEQHTAYGYSACVDKTVDSYLINLTVPAVGLRCDDE